MYTDQTKAAAAILLAVLLGISAEAVTAQSPRVAPEIIRTIENSRASEAFWSVIVCDSTGSILEGYNADKLVRPASNLKLLSSAAILGELGADYRYATKMYGLGRQAGRTWQGDIVIRGSGDPSISGAFYNEDRFHVFEKFYATLDSLGITRIDGNLIGNDAYFDRQPYPEGWSWDDLTFYYGVEISALSFNNNAVDLRVVADGDIGETPRIQWFPFDTDYVDFVNEQVITPPGTQYDEYYRRVMGTNRIILRSTLPQNYLETESLAVLNAPMFFIDTLKKYLEDGGITVSGRVLIDSQFQDWEHNGYKVLAEHWSVPLRRLLAQVNKDSDNFYIEMLNKTAAAEHYGTSGSTDLGLRLVRDFAGSAGMDTTKLEMSDASGMSPTTLLRLKDLGKLLAAMQHAPQFGVYKNSLAVAGVDGSLGHRFRSSPLKGNLRAKSGFLSGVRALSGYMNGASGRPLIVGIVTNNYTGKTAYIDYLHEIILAKIYNNY